MKPLCCTVEEYWFWKWDPNIPREPPVDYQAPIRVWDNQFCVDADGDQCEIDRAHGRCHQSQRAYEGIVAVRMLGDRASGGWIYQQVHGQADARKEEILSLMREGRTRIAARAETGTPKSTFTRWMATDPDFAAAVRALQESR